MRYTLCVVGNPDDLYGNPLGYKTCTKRTYWKPEYQRYVRWKEYLRGAFIQKYGDSLDLLKTQPLQCNGKDISIHLTIEWKDGRHPDNTNVLKGVEDALP